MDAEPTPRPLPEKVLRRHADMLEQLLPDIRRLVTEEGRPADALLSNHLRLHRELGSRDRRFLSQALFSYFRWYGWTIGRLGLSDVEACLLGHALDSTELSESFIYIGRRCTPPFTPEPLGNAPLDEQAVRLSERFGERLAGRPLTRTDLVPDDFEQMTDPSMAARCIEQFQQRPPTWLRLRSDPAPLLRILQEQQVPFETHPRLTDALALAGGTGLGGILQEHAAQFIIQDIASQCVGHVCAPARGEDWWDCCAGAGGKSLHLMDLMQQEGGVLSTDVRGPALKELKKRARRHGIRGIRTQLHNTARDEPFTKTFDGVLVDAPCSGWGTWPRNPDARWRTSCREVTQCAARQLKILNNAAWCTRPGGRLVYAVCTLTRPETEEVVMRFLDQNSSFRLDPFAHPLTGGQTDGQLQLWPWEGPGDAMFIARFVRLGT